MAINWKSIKDNVPTNVDKLYKGQGETPFVTCIVWVCNPKTLKGGVPDVVRWDTKRKCWNESDKLGKWIHEEPYQITHFCDNINIPEPTGDGQ